MFHGGICAEPHRVVDLLPLFHYATRPEIAPGVLAFAVPGAAVPASAARPGSAVKINFAGDDLERVVALRRWPSSGR